MGSPRFVQASRRKIKDKDFLRDAVPRMAREIRWHVFGRYWVEEFPQGFRIREEHTHYWIEETENDVIMKEKTYPSDEPINPMPWVYEVQDGYLLPGKYICWHGEGEEQAVKTYFPLTDTPDIFLKFASLGKSNEPDIPGILEFVHKYGMLKERESIITEDDFVFPGRYPLKAFFLYAREAYLILRIYEALLDKDAGKVGKFLSVWVDEIPNGLYLIEESTDWYLFLRKWSNYLPGIFYNPPVDSLEKVGARKATEKVERILELPKDDLNNIVRYREKDKSKWLKSAYLFIDGYSTFFWKTLFQKGPPKAIFEVAASLISAIVDIRVDKVWTVTTPVFPEESKTGSYGFKGSLSASSLLATIWLLFFLKITGQMEQVYRICPFCELPIIKPRKNQIYHNGCRQAKFNKDKREVLRLWKEGKSVDEIAAETGIDVARIKKWTKGD